MAAGKVHAMIDKIVPGKDSHMTGHRYVVGVLR